MKSNNYYKGIKPHWKQSGECEREGFQKETVFESFEDHPEHLPAPFYPKLAEAIMSGKLKGLTSRICGKFGGKCSGGHPECRKMRGWKDEV